MEYAADLTRRHRVNAKDALIAVAASGTTQFTLGCVREAKSFGALTVGIANNADTPLLSEPDHAIFLQTRAEPIAGSTRMNAGTAQRVTLNLLSTLIMIRLGRVYRGQMVDVQATNAKLAKRKEQMLVYLTGSTLEEARKALEASGGNLKLAVLVLHGCGVQQASAILADCDGRLRLAVDRVLGAQGHPRPKGFA